MIKAAYILLTIYAACCLCACSSDSSGDSHAGGAAAGVPVANFTASPRSGDPPLEVTFTNTSTSEFTSCSWDFGDGSTSSETNLQHTYSSEGAYTVSLTVVGPGGSDTETKVAYITCGNPPGPVVNFEGSPLSGDVPLDVSFTDMSTGDNVHAWSWDFGDGAGSTDRNPQHTYDSAGTYDVSLTVTDNDGSASLTKNTYIEVSDGGGNPGNATALVELIWCVPNGASDADLEWMAGRIKDLSDYLWFATEGQAYLDDQILVNNSSVGHFIICSVKGPMGNPPAYSSFSPSSSSFYTVMSTGALPAHVWLHEMGHVWVGRFFDDTYYCINGSKGICIQAAYTMGTGEGLLKWCDSTNCVQPHSGHGNKDSWTIMLSNHPGWIHPGPGGTPPACSVTIEK